MAASPSSDRATLRPMRRQQMEEFWQTLPPKLASKVKAEYRCYILSTQTEAKNITDTGREVVASVSLAKGKSHKCRLLLFNDCLIIVSSSTSTIYCAHNLCYVWVMDKPKDVKQPTNPDHSLLLQFPEEVATVTCVDAMGKEKIMWTVTAAIMRAMELDVDTFPRTTNIENNLRQLGKRQMLEYEFVDKSSELYGGTYKGAWYKGYPDGSGELRNPTTGVLYVGSFRRGNFDGNGDLWLSRVADDSQGIFPTEYRGGFEKGKYHGYGEMKYHNGDQYEGYWVEGKRCGHGRYEEKRGDRRMTVYFGSWENDKRSGYGVFEDTVKFIRYMGMFSNNARHGAGLLITNDGTYYESTFSNGDIGGEEASGLKKTRASGRNVGKVFNPVVKLVLENQPFQDGVDGFILSPSGHSFFGKIGPGCKLCGEGTLTMKNGVVVRGTFSGEWSKSVMMKNASLDGLFDASTDTGEAGDSQVTKVHSRIGFSCCKASEKWKPIVSHFQEQFGRDSSLLAMRQQPSGPNSSHPFREREEDILSASMPANSTSTETRKARSQTYMRVPSPAQTRRAELATEESVRKVLSEANNPACRLLNRLAALYHESYSGLGTSPFLLPHAINEAKEMIRQIHALIRSLFPHLGGDHSFLAPGGLRHAGLRETTEDWVNIDSGYELIQPHVFERVFPTLFSLYVLHHEEQDSRYKRGIRILNSLTDVQLAKHLSVHQRVVDSIAEEGDNSSVMKVVSECARQLDQIKTIFTPSESLKCLREVFNHISTSEQNQGMDESLPLVIMAVVRAKLPRLGAYVHFLFDFAWEQNQQPNTPEGFILTSFESVYAVIIKEADTWPGENSHD